MSGVDLYTVQRAGGWKTAVMVQRYTHLSPDHMRAALERLASGGTGTGIFERPTEDSLRAGNDGVTRLGVEPRTPEGENMLDRGDKRW
jgi:hypothetical protein